MASSATETARGAMSNQTIPMAMIGIGAAWLLMNRTSHGDGRWTGSGRDFDSRDERYSRNRYQWDGGQTAEWRDSGGVQPYTTGTALYGGSGYTYGRTSTSRRYDGGTNSLQRMLRDNPLLVGAGALMLGAAFGMAVPETELENEWMGEARESVVASAQDLAHDAAEKVQKTAGTVAEAAGRIVTGGDA